MRELCRLKRASSLIITTLSVAVATFVILTVSSVGAQPGDGRVDEKNCGKQPVTTAGQASDEGSDDSNGEAVTLDDWQAAFFEIELSAEPAGEVPPAPPLCPERFLSEQLDLSDEQQAQLQAILEEEHAQVERARRKTREAILQLLTEEQREQFEALPPPPPPHRPRHSGSAVAAA